jgi:hypothetical protein
MAIVLDGTSGITNDSGYTGDGVSFADSTPANTLVTTSGGNVGIGTSSPDIFSRGYTRTVGINSSGTTMLQLNGTTYSGADFGFNGTRTANIIAEAGGFYVQTNATAPLIFSTNFTERMRIDSAGNVGIGTSSPAYRLDVSTALTGTAAGDNTAIALNSQASGRDANIRFGDSVNATARIGYLSGALYMYTSGSERMRIDSIGNLSVGKTTAGESQGSGNGFSFNPDGGGAYYSVVQTSSGTGNACIYLNRYNSSGSMQIFRQNDFTVGSISHTTSSVAYNTSSDYRLKHDIQPMTGALAKVAALKPVTYKWNVDDSQSQGFIAHELQEVVPECVTGEKDAVDKDGKPVYQGIDTSFLVATLTAAIQEQQAIITALTARVEALEGAQA